MCEVTIKNFKEVLPSLKIILKSAKFIAIDTEFSCLTASHELQNSIFDSPKKRYEKLRKHIDQIIPVQIGLTAFTFEPERNAYTGNTYTFYVFPKPYASLDRKFVCQASSLLFLSTYEFDFNKFVEEGIPYLNEVEENEIRRHLERLVPVNSNSCIDFDHISEDFVKTTYKWLNSAEKDDTLILNNYNVIKNRIDFKYFLHKQLRDQFTNLWTYDDGSRFKIKKITAEERKSLMESSNLEEELISDLLGFTKIFRYIQSLQKPIIGHNLLVDLLLILHNLDNPLPSSYSSFKKSLHRLFPDIFDTKHMGFEFLNLVSEDKRWKTYSLEEMYTYFKDGYGRHLASNSPMIETQADYRGNFHSAGWDSFCTGYVFIRMAHTFAMSKNQIKSKIFMTKELLHVVSTFKNKINIIRGEVSYIKLDGNDPPSSRPPWLIIEALERQCLDINEVTCMLGNYGFVEIKPYSYKGNRAVVAVDNFGNAKRILKQFQSHSDFKVQQYNFLRHSPVANAFIWSGIILSGTFLAWYGYLKMR